MLTAALLVLVAGSIVYSVMTIIAAFKYMAVKPERRPDAEPISVLKPLSGAEVPEYGDPDIREVFEHPYRIIYRVSGPDVQVLAVIHSSRRMPRTPPG